MSLRAAVLATVVPALFACGDESLLSSDDPGPPAAAAEDDPAPADAPGGGAPPAPRPLVQAALDGAGSFAGATYLFRGGAYRRYQWAGDHLDDGGSLPIFAFHLPARFHAGIDAALAGRGRFSGAAYFFRGAEYVRTRWSSGRVDHGPVAIAAGWGLPAPFASGVTAAVNGAGPYAGKAYFFRGAEYVRYDWATERVDQAAQPLSAWGLPAPFDRGVDAVISGQGASAGKLYFVRGREYVRYDWARGEIDGGVRSVADEWPALLGLEEPPARRMVLYVTIDTADHHGAGGDAGAHQLNFGHLRHIASRFDPTMFVDDFWAPDVTAAMLADPHVLAVFGAGSFTEWGQAFRDPAWSALLARWSELLRDTSTPVLAVCGSHQLLAQAFAGWTAVGHMQAVPNPDESIALEADGRSRIPSPRPGEHGVFPVRGDASDPLLAGMGQDLRFVASHSDEVIAGRHATAFRVVGVADPGRPARRPPDRAAEADIRSTIQILRHADPARVLYSTQFHPELPARATYPGIDPTAAASADASGERLIHNFLDLAREHWARVR